MWTFEGSTEKEAEFPRVVPFTSPWYGVEVKTHVEFPWVLVFDVGISKRYHTILLNFKGSECLFSPGFFRVKLQMYNFQRIEGRRFRKSYPQLCGIYYSISILQ